MRRAGDRSERRVGRKVRSRRSVPPVVDDAGPAARCLESSGTRRVGGDPRDSMREQQTLGVRRRPGRVPRLADDRQVVQAAKQAKEAAGHARIEGERRRQLNQERTERVAEPGDFAEEPGQRLARSRQGALVGDQLGDLDGEAKRRRHGGGPALIDRRGVRAVEGGVDFERRSSGWRSAGAASRRRRNGRGARAGCSSRRCRRRRSRVRAKQEAARRLIGVPKRKPAKRTSRAFRRIMPAATYSPTQFPMQYHRRYEA